MECEIFNVCMWSFCMHVHTGDLGLASWISVAVCHNLQTCAIWGNHNGCNLSLNRNRHHHQGHHHQGQILAGTEGQFPGGAQNAQALMDVSHVWWTTCDGRQPRVMDVSNVWWTSETCDGRPWRVVDVKNMQYTSVTYYELPWRLIDVSRVWWTSVLCGRHQ